MWHIKNEIINASKLLNISSFVEVRKDEANLIIAQIVGKYCNGKVGRFIWENFTEEMGINDKDAWKWVKDIVGNEEAIMFFNPEDERMAFKFNNGEDIMAILAETYGFEFYLTNQMIDYVVCFNHHDVLIACGKAREWIIKNKDI